MVRLLVVVLTVLVTSSVSWGSPGNAVVFDGLQDYVMVPHHSSLSPGGGSWTIALWIKPADEVLCSPLIIKRQPMAPYEQYSLGIGDNDPHIPVAGRKLYLNYIDAVDVSERSGLATDEFVDGQWHHVVIVADALSNEVSIFEDGIEQGFLLLYDPGEWPNIANTDSLFIATNYNSRFYKGQMDELSLWGRALSPAQIQAVMNDTLGPDYYATPDSGLVGYWRFDEFEDLGVGSPGINDVRDLSFYGNHGDAEGAPQLIPSGIPVGVSIAPVPSARFALEPNHPNPFNPTTRIVYSIPVTGPGVTLRVYDIAGREVAVLADGEGTAGRHEVRFDGSALASGVYFYRLQAGPCAETRKMVMVR